MKTILHNVLLMKRRSLLLMISFLIWCLSAVAQSTFSNADTIDIPASGIKPISGVPYPSNIAVSGMNGIISDLQVSLYGYEHNLSDAVDMLLVAPDGSSAVIFSDAGGAVDVYGVNITLDDSAALMLPDRESITTGTYKPANWGFGPDSWNAPAPSASGQTALSTFYGIDPNGTWSLYLVSDTRGTFGKLTGGWSLTITTMKASQAVRFSNFTATYSQSLNNVTLNWNTEFEYGTGSFDVDRSVAGGDWTTIAKLSAAGFSAVASGYQYIDQDVADGRYLYRIKMIAKDNSIKYSPVAFADVNSGNNYLVYPNAATSYVNIRPDSPVPEKIRVTLTDAGQVIYAQAEGMASRTSPFRFDLSFVKRGTYYLIITTSNRRYSKTIRVL